MSKRLLRNQRTNEAQGLKDRGFKEWRSRDPGFKDPDSSLERLSIGGGKDVDHLNDVVANDNAGTSDFPSSSSVASSSAYSSNLNIPRSPAIRGGAPRSSAPVPLDRYGDPTMDMTFKMLFGTDENKEILISIINNLYHAPPERRQSILGRACVSVLRRTCARAQTREID